MSCDDEIMAQLMANHRRCDGCKRNKGGYCWRDNKKREVNVLLDVCRLYEPRKEYR